MALSKSLLVILLLVAVLSLAAGRQKKKIGKTRRRDEYTCGIRNGPHKFSDEPQKAKEGEFPWVVSIRLKHCLFPKHICTGTLLNALFIITTGTCVGGVLPDSLEVAAGTSNIHSRPDTFQVRNVARIFDERDERVCCNLEDVAMVRMKKQFKIDGTSIAPICLMPDGFPFPDAIIIADWQGLDDRGYESMYELNHVTLKTIPLKKCKQRYDTKELLEFVNDSPRECAIAKEHVACQVSSGGPAMCLNKDEKVYYLCGVINWGVGCMKKEGDEYLPAVFTPTSPIYDWIYDIMLKHDID